jgi:hypothetical protein
MSLHEKCIQCKDIPITFEQIIKSLIREDSEGNRMLPLKFNLCSEDDVLAVRCGKDETAEELFRSLIVLNDCNQCSIKVSIDQSSADLICDICDQRKQL